MIELIGVALVILSVIVAAVAYLYVYCFRYRWQIRALEQENRRLLDQVVMLERENEPRQRALPPGAQAGQEGEVSTAARLR